MKHLRYLRYVIRHKWFVFAECCKLDIPWRGILHDLSKFGPPEWFPYAEFFYGEYCWQRGSELRPPKHIDDAFDLAWLHHLHYNPHHWQYWIRHGDDGGIRVFPMPLMYASEMVADWRGAGRAQGKPDTAAWYLENKDKMTLHENTRRYVESLLLGTLYST